MVLFPSKRAEGRASLHHDPLGGEHSLHVRSWLHLIMLSLTPLSSHEICSPGRLPPPMTEELLRVRHRSYPRNPQIAGIFYLCGYIEKLGAGIERMRRFMQD